MPWVSTKSNERFFNSGIGVEFVEEEEEARMAWTSASLFLLPVMKVMEVGGGGILIISWDLE